MENYRVSIPDIKADPLLHLTISGKPIKEFLSDLLNAKKGFKFVETLEIEIRKELDGYKKTKQSREGSA